MCGIEFGYYLSKEKQYECQYNREYQKLHPLCAEHQHLRECQVQKQDYRHVDQVIGRKYGGQETLRVGEQSRGPAAAGRIVLGDTLEFIGRK